MRIAWRLLLSLRGIRILTLINFYQPFAEGDLKCLEKHREALCVGKGARELA